MSLLGPLTRPPLGMGYHRSKDGRWAIGQMEHCRRWYVYENDNEWPSFGEAFATLRDAREHIEMVLERERDEDG